MKLFSKKDNDDFIVIENETVTKAPPPENPNVLTVEEVLGKEVHKASNTKSTGALDSLKKRMLTANGTITEEPKKPEQEQSLLQKCRPYIIDEKGEDTSKDIPPAYKLESVADILKKEKKDAVDDFNQKYDFEADYLGKYVEQKLAEEKEAKKPKPITPPISGDTIVMSAVKNAQTNVAFTISDIDPLVKTIPSKAESESGATITFTPVASGDTAPVMMVSSKTQPIDLTGEISAMEDISSNSKPSYVELEKSDFDDYVPRNEIKSEIDSKRFIRTFSIKKRNYFLISAVSVLFTFFLGIMRMPFMTGTVLSHTKTTMIICTVFLGVISIVNYDMFLSLRGMLKKRTNADVTASLCVITVLVYCILGIKMGKIITDLCLFCAVAVTLRAIGQFQKYSYLLSNLRQITKKTPKKAVRLLGDPTVTYAMAKNSIEGDALIAATSQTENIDDYIKYSTYGTFLNGKLPIITVISLLLSLLTFFATFKYYNSFYYGFYAAAAVQCFCALPALFFIDNLPLLSAAKKLNRRGAMIAGKAGAEHIELANALVLNADDIFPKGTVTLHNMKVLSENNMSDTILRAASLTRELSSPLFPVFEEIAGKENMQSLPAADTVKYEDKMGISGWVDDQLLFIGNRTIMEAHGITVPDIETDHKILRNGYFPVYVATENTAVALLIIKYTVDPAVVKELYRLTNMGVNILINNTDPNVSKEMVCDYLGLFEDSVMVMSAAGSNMQKNTLTPTEHCSAPACFRGKQFNLAKILNCANRIRKSNTVLTVMYILSAIAGILMFTYSAFTSAGNLMSGSTILLYSLISTILTIGLYLTQKP